MGTACGRTTSRIVVCLSGSKEVIDESVEMLTDGGWWNDDMEEDAARDREDVAGVGWLIGRSSRSERRMPPMPYLWRTRAYDRAWRRPVLPDGSDDKEEAPGVKDMSGGGMG